MQQHNNAQTVEAKPLAGTKVLELTVNNHPGVMSHICGLFSRRSFNMEGILCMPDDGGVTSRVWIRTEENGQLDQIVKQLQKLEDVQSIRFHSAVHTDFVKLEKFFNGK